MKNKEKCILCGNSPESEYSLNLNESFLTSYLMKKMEEPFINSQAFKLGIIDENGNQLKRPITIDEKLAFTAIDAYITKLKKLVGNKIDILNTSVFLERLVNTSNLPIELYEKELQFKSELSIISKRFKDCLMEAKTNGLPSELIEKTILESFK
jgi:hypothetical protein